MKEIRNTTGTPLRIPLPGGKVLFLGPGKVAQVTDKAAEHAALRRLVAEGAVELLAESAHAEGISAAGGGAEQTHGRSKSTFRRRQGER